MKTWNEIFKEISKKDYSKKLKEFLTSERKSYIIYPPKELMYEAFKLTPYSKVKVVIFGQDPYSHPKQAMGLCFSVPNTEILPPSLRNIYKEIGLEYHIDLGNKGGDLTYLAKQGVLLLNPILTVRAYEPLSHDNIYYSMFTRDIILEIEKNNNVIVYLLWGNKAKYYEKYITNKNHYVLKANHPSPLSANRGGWFNNGCFIKTNEILKSHNIEEIKWY